MFKDYKKFLEKSLKVYIFVLLVLVILKLIGLDYFGLDLNNPIVNKLNTLYINYKLDDIICVISLFFQISLFTGIVCRKRNLYVYNIINCIILTIAQIILMKVNMMDKFYFIITSLSMIITPMIIDKRIYFKRQIAYILVITFYQFVSLFIRNISFHYEYGNLLVDTILNIDQLILLAITYNIVMMKGDKEIWEQEVYSFSQKKTNLKKLLQELQKNLHNFKNKEKVEKLTIIIYLILSLIWNTLSVIIILLVARLNHTLIECLFILTSFWLSKRAFGKPFHLDSMSKCFIVSNLTYYILNRITAPLGISIFVPIILGVGLSYITSKLVKKTYKPLYRGISKELFEETILKVTDKDSIKYKICYDFYINNKSDLSLSFQYNYSIAGIRKIKTRINEEIKKL